MKWQKGNSNSYLPKDKDKKMFYDNQRRGINDGSLASRLLADILQHENSIRNPGAEKVKRVMNKRSHGLLDNLLRPPPPPAGVSLSERLAEDLLDSLETVTSTRVRRDQEEMAEDDEDLNSRGISAQEMSPPQLIQLKMKKQKGNSNQF